MIIDASNLDFRQLCERVRACSQENVTIQQCLGQRFIASGLGEKQITIHGTPGNALGAYLNGARITVYGNAQDAMGDTMNAGEIVVHGSVGDAPGYAMRGGRILIKGDAGYRAGIHMKAYADRVPVMVIGGRAGSFLGEYQAGGRIIVLGIGMESAAVGNFCGTGMHGGSIYIRSTVQLPQLPPQVAARLATPEDKEVIREDVMAFCEQFGGDASILLEDNFFLLLPNTKNPYQRHYVHAPV